MKDLACGCPGSHVRTIERTETEQPVGGKLRSELRQWPTQLHLVPPTAPWLADADLLVVADCVPMAYADFHRDFVRERVLVQACPKLDETEPYVDKLTAIFQHNNIRSVTVPIMEVPCCRGLDIMVRQAIEASGKEIPLETVIVGVDGERRN